MQNKVILKSTYPMNFDKQENSESRSSSPNLCAFNGHQYSQNARINTNMPLSISNTSDVLTVSKSIIRSLPPNMPLNMQRESSDGNIPRNHPVIEFNAQYNKLQQARTKQQMITHNEAMLRKQQTFAMRQMLNPPTMSRQASAINLHQVNSSTQTTPNAQQSQMFQNNLNLNNQFDNPNSIRTNVLNNFNGDADLSENLMKMYKSRAGLSLNPFTQDIEMDQMANNNRCSSGAQSPPVHQSVVYREPSSLSATSTPTKQLKSPKTKRQPTSLVTFSGWLYKQGSEGLKAWKRRWFVLSDYCLFYYKGPEEDKLLGSILLPSYVLSECLPLENKAHRKFSFKLEHKNMRTYYLASENGDYMRKWMRFIRDATMMQNFHETQTKKMLAGSTAISTSVITNYDTNPNYDQRYQENYDQKNMHPSLNPFLIFDEDERQPIYMNAPPKPRRIQNEPEYPIKSDLSALACSADKSMDSAKLRMFEYEDVDIGIDFRENELPLPSTYHENIENSPTTPSNDEAQHKNMPPRPHSADFLEYESKRQFRLLKDFSLSGAHTAPHRPKSSLDLTMDNFYYSEASYAAKMRQSALYMQNRNLMSKDKKDSRLKTLRYENDRKRLTNEFNNYTANYLCGGRWASTFPQVPQTTSDSSNQWKISSLTRSNGNYSEYGNEEDQYLFDLDYDSSEMLNEEEFIRNRKNDQNTANNMWGPNISAGTLLSKSHEELVLMLIQLRRQNDMQERGLSYRLKEMEAIQNRLRNESDVTATRLELMGKLEILREKVNKLEQQYEKTKPLVNLVDNMVKLGSLYRAESSQCDPKRKNIMHLDGLRSNQIEIECRAQVDDEKHWRNFSLCQTELNEKVQRLYELDQRLQEESNNLQILQQDKQDIEATLDELKHRLATNQIPPENYIASKKIRRSLQLELCKVHSELAEHACNLEITVSQNSKLEKELLVLRQKWQASRDKKDSSSNLTPQNHQNNGLRIVDAFESELKKVRDSVGDMKRQREELSMAVSQLTLDSQMDSCQERISKDVHHMNMYSGKYIQPNWTETDIDSTQKRNSKKTPQFCPRNDHELYYQDYNSTDEQWQDKQEIRTVRVVKREAERRNREKDRSNFEIDSINSLGRRNTSRDDIPNYSAARKTDSNAEYYHIREPSTFKKTSTIRNMKNPRNNINKTNTMENNDNIFQSNTAREILDEMSKGNSVYIAPTKANSIAPGFFTPSQSNQFKRVTPRKKKRHNTAPHSENFLDYMAERDSHKSFQNVQRARDDLDMEVVLRSNTPNENIILGPPDVVRSAMGSSSEYLFN